MSRPPLDDDALDERLRGLRTEASDVPLASVDSILERASGQGLSDTDVDDALRRLGTGSWDVPATPVPTILHRAGIGTGPVLRPTVSPVAAALIVGLGVGLLAGFGSGVRWAREEAPAAAAAAGRSLDGSSTSIERLGDGVPATVVLPAPLASAGDLASPEPARGAGTAVSRHRPKGTHGGSGSAPIGAAPLPIASGPGPWADVPAGRGSALLAMGDPWGDDLPPEPRMRRAPRVPVVDPEPPFHGDGEIELDEAAAITVRRSTPPPSRRPLAPPQTSLRGGLGLATGLSAWGDALPPAGPAAWVQLAALGEPAPVRPLAALSVEGGVLLGGPGVMPRSLFGADGDLGAGAGNDIVRAEITGAFAARLAPPGYSPDGPGGEGAGWLWFASGPRFGLTVGRQKSLHLDVAPLISVVDHDGDGRLSAQPWLSVRMGIELGVRREP